LRGRWGNRVAGNQFLDSLAGAELACAHAAAGQDAYLALALNCGAHGRALAIASTSDLEFVARQARQAAVKGVPYLFAEQLR